MCWETGPSIPSHPRWDKIEGGVYLEDINKLTSGLRPLVGEYKGAAPPYVPPLLAAGN